MPYPPELRWLVYPARHSVAFLPYFDPRAPNEAGIRYLDPLDDGMVPAGEISLPRHFSTQELEELIDPRAVAATAFGPPQEKASNEDFAVSAIINTAGQTYAFAAVADGVSRRTFWAARTSRIAALTAYATIATQLAGHAELGDPNAAQQIVDRMAEDIRLALLEDRENLSKANAVPADWNPDVYRRRSTDLSMWYRSTLLVGVIGKDGGFLAAAGDGGLRAIVERSEKRKTTLQESVLIRSVDGEPLKHFVDDQLTPGRFQIYRINVNDGRDKTHIIFASDGVDNTLQKLAPDTIDTDNRVTASGYRQLPLSNQAEAQDFLTKLATLPETTVDNLSIARLTWPIPDAGADWRAWPKTDLFALIEKEAARQREARAANPQEALPQEPQPILPRAPDQQIGHANDEPQGPVEPLNDSTPVTEDTYRRRLRLLPALPSTWFGSGQPAQPQTQDTAAPEHSDTPNAETSAAPTKTDSET